MFKIDRGEKLWEQIHDEKGRLLYLITSDKQRETYYLYKVLNDSKDLKKIGKGRTPPDLYRKYL